jgi:Tfp pilus tip-associated adhesin PilY1
MGGGYSLPDASNPPDEISDWVYVIDTATGRVISDGTTNAKFLVDLALGPHAPNPYPALPKNNVASEIAAFRPNDTPFISQAYFGTTQGRVYGMYLTNPSVARWAPVKIFDPYDATCEGDIFQHSQAPIERASDGAVVGRLPLAFTSTPPPFFARPIVSFDVQGRPLIFMGTGDTTNPASTTEPTNYFYAIRDSQTGTPCSGTVEWVKQFAPNEKVVSAPVVVNGTLILSTYTPPTSGSACVAPGNSTLYAFDAVFGTPVNALTQLGSDGLPLPPVVNSQGVPVPQSASQVTIPNRGILSDLTVSNGNLVYVTEIAPTVQGSGATQRIGAASMPLNLAPSSVRILSWRRVR